MSSILSLNNVSYTTADGRILFEDISLSFDHEITALVGPNGIGKTTLLKILTRTLPATSGSVTGSGTFGVLSQDLTPQPGDSIADAFGIKEQIDCIQRILAGDGSLDDNETVDWTLENRLEAALASVELSQYDALHPLQNLSGGERTRLTFAALLFQAPDMLILDEPTNNLDSKGRRILLKALSQWKGGAIIVSHDRALLKEVDRIIELSSRGLQLFGGNWDKYCEIKEIERQATQATLAHAEKKQSETSKKIQASKEKKSKSDSKGKAGRSTGSQPKMLLNARKNRAEGTSGRLSAIAERQQEEIAAKVTEARSQMERLKAPSIVLPSTHLTQAKTILQIEKLSFGYPDAPPLFKNVSMDIKGPERIALTGTNGSGKTTLLKLVTGKLLASQGHIKSTPHKAMLDQHADILDPKLSVRDNFQLINPGESENACRAALARFLFRADAALHLVGELSGGEAFRAALACTLGCQKPPELLILDEPTNHLDLLSIEAIESGLSDYDGALLISSHDDPFLEAINIKRRIEFPLETFPS